ncbi:MAG: DNA mismatch repair endonuclease MutL [Bdellovibrionales bacterium]|nr:DNA mismatch repair endonuclease MutL [Bdellovibrionales bacterium]
MQITPSIHILSDETVRRIAAGEVIERPYSIVKELMENAVDAFATIIEVSVTEGGMGEIKVVDNGIGFTPQDLPLSVVKNATSKITTDHDLLSIQTNGFRGEALSSISSVSKFAIITKSKTYQEGLELRADGNTSPEIKPAASKDGTTVIVKDLFFNVPARKKFLKSKTTEFSHIEKTCKKIALAHPEIHIVLKKEHQVVLNLPTCSSYQERIAQLYQKNITDSLIAFTSQKGPISVHGFASNAKNTLHRPSEIWIFVNNRWVSDRALTKAIYEGYRTTLLENKYPYVFLFITMPPDLFDVNVHPTKSEVRFVDTQTLFQMIQEAISSNLKGTLANHRFVFQPKTMSFAPTQRELTKIQAPSQLSRPSYLTYEPKEQSVETTTNTTLGYFGSLSFLTVLDGTYIVCNNSNELVLIDQHAAHERVLFEKYQTQYKTTKKLSQQTLIPVTITLSPSQIESLQSISEQLDTLGIVYEIFGEDEILIRSIPELFSKENIETLIFELVEQIQKDELPTKAQDAIDHILSTMACHSAVRAHDRLSSHEIEKLLQDMDQLDLASYCPHGRPTFLTMGLSELEKLFQRKV